nr:MAG TPA: voltage-gated sodium channel protein [Crassvirales sp.]
MIMDISILITGGVGLLTSIISSWTTWFFARRKYNSEVDLNLVEKMEKSLEFYKSLSDDNKNRLEEITERNNELEKEVQELRKQVLNLTMNICMDLTCSHRIREITRKYGKNKDRFDETSNSSRG